MAAVFELRSIFIFILIGSVLSLDLRYKLSPIELPPRDVLQLGEHNILFDVFEPFCCWTFRVSFKRIDAQRHLHLNYPVCRASKYGLLTLGLADKLFYMDLTVHMDIQGNPGPLQLEKTISRQITCPRNVHVNSNSHANNENIKYSRQQLLDMKAKYIMPRDVYLPLKEQGLIKRGRRTRAGVLVKSKLYNSFSVLDNYMPCYEQTCYANQPIPVIISSSRRRSRCDRDFSLQIRQRGRTLPNLIIVPCTPCAPAIKPCKAIHFSLLNVRSLNNKAGQVHDFIADNNIDIMGLTETWLCSANDGNSPVITESTPRGYVLRHVPRGGRGGGVAIIFKKSLKLKITTPRKFKSLEYMDATLKSATKSLRVVILYRPPPSKTNKLTCDTFFCELTTLMELLACDSGNAELLIAGDFNLHVDDKNNLHVRKFLQTINSFDFIQHIDVPTHKKNHTLDLILTRSSDKLVNKLWVSDPQLSDHFAVNCKLMITKPSFPRKLITFRKIKDIDISQVKSDIANSGLLEELQVSLSTGDLVEKYEKLLTSIRDKHAPVKTRVVILRPAAPWITPEIRKQKIERRRLERKWRATGLTVHREMYAQQSVLVNNLTSSAKRAHFSELISSCGSDQRELFKIIEHLNKGIKEKQFPPARSAEVLANQFADFFECKIDTIRHNLSRKSAQTTNPLVDSSLPLCVGRLDHFTPVNCEELSPLVKKISTKSCKLDPLPAEVLKSCLPVLLPVITRIVNASLESADVPDCLKHAILEPRLKKVSLDTDEFSSFRPISNLKFVAKAIEKVVAIQTCQHVSDNNLDELYQSAYKTNHSTETALLKVQNDILRALDSQNSVILLLLDLSAAFDTVDHNMLLHRLRSRYGITGMAYDWYESYLSRRKLTVIVPGGSSTERPLTSGVPQGSVLGPILFSMYTAPLGDLIRLHDMNYHLYADDTQLYITFKSNNPEDMNTAKLRMEACVRDVDAWMAWNNLKLNGDKTELLLLNARHRPLPPLQCLSVCDDTVYGSLQARNIGVLMDSSLSMEQHITNMCKAGFFHLRNISRIRKYLSCQSAETLVHAFITSRLDFCNAVLYGLPSYLIDRLQKVQNAAARVVTLSRKYDHITPVLYDLHWLPVEYRIMYKLLVLTYKALNGLAPKYVADLIDMYIPRRSLRSSKGNRLVPSNYNLRTYGYRAFSCAAPLLWNSLPQEIKMASSLSSFKAQIKTNLFKQAFEGHRSV